MRIFMDGQVFSLQRAGGISKYTTEICSYIWDQKSHDLRVGVFPGAERNLFAQQMMVAYPDRFLAMDRKDLGWPLRDWRHQGPIVGSEILHSPYMNLPKPRLGRVQILSINDLIFLNEKRTLRSYGRELLMRTAIKRADAFAFISEEAARDFNHRFPAQRHKPQRVIYLAASSTFTNFASRDADEVLPDSIRGGEYLLFVGGREGYKRFAPFLRVFGQSRHRNDFAIVCIGGGSFTSEEQQLIEDSVPRGAIHLQNLDEDRLAQLYGHATALVYPSLREGFGLPIIEALNCRCPVICHEASSMQEVGRDHPFYFRELCREEINRVLDEVRQQQDQADIDAAQAYARDFTWRRTAESLLSYYSELREMKL